MPLPGNLSTITLTGTFLDTTGAPLSGTLSFTPPPELVDASTAIMYAAPVTVTLDSNGHFSTTLICTDNGTLTPAGWGYTVAENVKTPVSYVIYVPHTLGSTVDLSNLVPLPTLTGVPASTSTSAVAPGYGALAYNNTWSGQNVFTGEVTVPVPVNPTDPATKAYADALTAAGAAGGDLSGTFPNPEVITTHLATPLPVAQGGTGQASLQAVLNALAGAVTAGSYLRANGTNVVLATIQAADVPTLNQNTSGNAATATTATTAATATNFSGVLAGDVTGTQGATTVGKIQGVAVTAAEALLVSDLNNASTRSATATLLPGEETVYTGSTGSQTLTLPASPPASSINTITNAATVSVTVAPGAGATLSNFGTTGNLTIPSGYAFSLVYIGTTWYVTQAGPSDFAKNSLLSIANGGTGAATAQAAINALAGAVTSGSYLRGNGTNVVLSTIQAADLPAGTTSTAGALKLDGTSTDIQSLGVQAAGASGLAADAKHVHPYTSGCLTSATTVTGVTTATLLFGGPTLAASTARAGLIYTFELWGVLSTAATANTVAFTLYWGGVTGTSLAAVGPSQPSTSGTVTNGAWKMRFSLTFLSATQVSASGEDALNYFYTSETQGGLVTISNASAQQLVIGVTPNATGVSVTANGAYWHEKG